MAPEQLMGGRADGRTDIYTLGVVAYEMIVGRRPFNEVGLELLTTQLTEDPPLPSTIVAVPHVVDDVLLRCMKSDTAERYQNVHELARALGEALAAHPIVPVMPAPQPYPIAPHATLQRAETPPPITGPFPRPPVTGPFGKAPMTSPFSREPPPLLARAPRALLVGAAALFVLGVGLLIAYFV
jgi:serine/threonine-protein kinase